MAALNRLMAWQRRLLYVALALLSLSGVAWLLIHYVWGAGAGELPHPLEAWLIRVHGAAAFAALFTAGILAAGHIPHGWRMTAIAARHHPRRAHQRRTGILLCSFGALAVASGYLLYYFAPEAVRPPLGWGHAAVGLLLALCVPFHGRRPSRGAELQGR